jgi:hypothetical protein
MLTQHLSTRKPLSHAAMMGTSPAFGSAVAVGSVGAGSCRTACAGSLDASRCICLGRRTTSAHVMSAVAGRVLDAAVSDARAAAPLRCIGCNGRECKAECQADSALVLLVPTPFCRRETVGTLREMRKSLKIRSCMLRPLVRHSYRYIFRLLFLNTYYVGECVP